MPIASDSTKFSFEFAYEWEGPDGTRFTFPMKYLHTEQYGPTLQIYFGENQGVELPADMFPEVSNFLIAQGVVQGALPPSRVPVPTVGGGKPMGVPLLKRATPGVMATALQAQHSAPASQSPFVPPQAYQSQTLNPLAPRVEVGSLSAPQAEVPSLSNEEIMAARAAAKARAAASGPRMRKGHLPDQYDPPPTSMQHRAKATADAIEAEHEAQSEAER